MKTIFTLNFVNKSIVGTKSAITRANKCLEPEYSELCALLEKHPNFKVEVKKIEQKKEKKTYTGLTFDVMKAKWSGTICYPSNYPRLESSDYLGNNRQNQCGQMTNRSIICGSEVALFAVKKLASDAAVTSTRDSRRNPSLWLFLVG